MLACTAEGGSLATGIGVANRPPKGGEPHLPLKDQIEFDGRTIAARTGGRIRPVEIDSGLLRIARPLVNCEFPASVRDCG
jgi:hypothetical protein